MTNSEIKDFLNQSTNCKNVPRGAEFWKRSLLQTAINQMSNLIVIKGLPASLPRYEIELNLILKGQAVFIEKEGKVWVPFGYKTYGGLSSNVYRSDLQFVGSNPIMGSSQGFDMLDGVIAYNCDVDRIGGSILLDTIKRYANLMAHCESTLANSLINKRGVTIVSVATAPLAASVDNTLKQLEIGNTKTIQAEQNLIDQVKSTNFSDNNNLSDLTQIRDYLHNSFLNEIGLQTLEEKKERMITDELSLDDDVLNANIYSYLRNRYEMVRKLNTRYNLNLSIVFKG